jgi:hypothetical protein
VLLLEVPQPDPEKSEFLRSQALLFGYAYKFAVGRHPHPLRAELAERVNAFLLGLGGILSLWLVLGRAIALGRELHDLAFGHL